VETLAGFASARPQFPCIGSRIAALHAAPINQQENATMMHWKTPARLLLVPLLIATLGPTAARANVEIFSTGDFLPSEWSSQLLPGSTGTGTSFTEAAGGNPGAYRRVSLTVDPFEWVLDAQLWSVARFTPATQGMVGSVSLSYDVSRVFTSDPGATQIAKGIAVRQNGVLHSALLGVSVATPPTWESVAVADLLPLFPAVDWVNGSTITFGFYNSVATSSSGFTIDGGYDNYRVAVSFTPQIPEPSSFAFLSIGVAALLAVRCRRRLTWSSWRSVQSGSKTPSR
jgi:hypothetical protein